MGKNKGILFAADVLEEDKLIEIISDVSPFISMIKIGNLLFYEHSFKIIKKIKDIISIPIIADLKLLDMPNMASRITELAVNNGVDGIIVAGAIGQEGIIACQEILRDKYLFVFTQFTHCGGLINDREADEYVKLALHLECSGVQVPATKKGRVKQIKEIVGDKLIIISCGIGTQKFYTEENYGPEIGSALIDGADYEIIGRSIYNPKLPISSPKEAALLAFEKIKNIL
jgi:orotidine-5'-phosphate decarboxylase